MSKKILTGIVAAALIVTAAGVVLWRLHNNSPIPKDIKRQISFAIWSPSKTNGGIEKSTVKYNSANKVLSFQSTYSNAHLIISEQSFPDQFVDVPQAYEKFLQQLPAVTSFESINGQVNIGQPPNLKGDTLVVTNAKGTFIFIRTSKNIPEDSWRQFFNSLEIIK